MYLIMNSLFLILSFTHVINGKCNCGMRGGKGKVSNRIIEGKPTTKHPWQVSIRSGQGLCGGTIISSQYILTAAHCVFGSKTIPVTVRVGSSTLSGGKVIGVSKIFGNNYKEDCDKDGFCQKIHNNIAILKLKSLVKFNKNIQPVCIPSHKREYPYRDGTSVVATGFGETRTNGTISHQLLEVKLKTSERHSIMKGFISTFGQKKAVCSGDSGGPLMIRKKKR